MPLTPTFTSLLVRSFVVLMTPMLGAGPASAGTSTSTGGGTAGGSGGSPEPNGGGGARGGGGSGEAPAPSNAALAATTTPTAAGSTASSPAQHVQQPPQPDRVAIDEAPKREQGQERSRGNKGGGSGDGRSRTGEPAAATPTTASTSATSRFTPLSAKAFQNAPDSADADSDQKSTSTSANSVNRQIKDFAQARGLTVEDLLAKLQADEDASTQAITDLTGEKDAALRRAQELERQLQESHGRNAIYDAAAKAHAINARAIFALVRDDLTFDPQGKPTNVDALLTAIRQSDPELFRAADGSGDGGEGSGSGRGGNAPHEDVSPGLGRLRQAYQNRR